MIERRYTRRHAYPHPAGSPGRMSMRDLDDALQTIARCIQQQHDRIRRVEASAADVGRRVATLEGVVAGLLADDDQSEVSLVCRIDGVRSARVAESAALFGLKQALASPAQPRRAGSSNGERAAPNMRGHAGA